LSATLNAAVKLPASAGVNVTEIVQLEPAASGLSHVLVCAKSAALVPVIEMLNVSGAAPVFINVADCAALVVPVVALNVSDGGVSETIGARPVPVRATVCGEPVALSATFKLAVKLPAAAGVNVTEIVQLEPAASDAPQVVAL
jgi:hypothetical protein